MKIRDIDFAKTLKLNKDIPSLGLKKEDVLCATAEYPNNKTFMFRSEQYSAGSSIERIVTLSSSVIEEDFESFTVIDSFQKPKKTYQLNDVSTEDLMVMFMNISEEIQKRIDDTLPKENRQSRGELKNR